MSLDKLQIALFGIKERFQLLMNKLKTFFEKYKHSIPLLIYFPIYLTWFAWLEKTVTKHYQVIHVAWDDYIPFCEVFVVPYFLWFFYIAAVIVFLFFNNRQDYYRCCIFLFTGMTIFLTVSTLWPNGHHLRLESMPRDNIFTRMIEVLWQTDTATNLWPSIHVYNSIGAHFAVIRSEALENKKGIKLTSLILAISIVLSTVLIKQHSLFDVFTAIGLAAVMYVLVYRRDAVLAARAAHQHNKRNPQIG